MPRPARIVCLSNVFDQHYHDLRGEPVARSLGAKRQVLFQCLATAAGRELVVLSAPPKALNRRGSKWLPPVETEFAGFRQWFCSNWDAPKLRVPLSWFFYARHLLRQVRSGDLVLIDNYELVYVIGAWGLKLFRRRVVFILDYEDGKHLIDRSWDRLVSGLAEMLGRPLIRGALLAHPGMARRLPAGIPTEVIPGFIAQKLPGIKPKGEGEVRFLYSGTMDRTRGLDLLLEALALLPEKGWRLDITGHGELAGQVTEFTKPERWCHRVKFHGSLPPAEYQALLNAAHAGMNCQRSSDPISDVTFPSKVFTYLAAGLLVVSSRASAVEPLCGNACFYYGQETPQSLANAMTQVIADYSGIASKLDLTTVSDRYSVEATTARLRRLFQLLNC